MKKKNRQESGVARANRIKAATRLFPRKLGNWKGKEGVSFQTYTYRGRLVQLRFSHKWTAICPALGIETTFAHRPAQDIEVLLNHWIDEKIGRPSIGITSKLMQWTPAVQEFATRHNISLPLAAEMTLERGF